MRTTYEFNSSASPESYDKYKKSFSKTVEGCRDDSAKSYRSQV